MNAAGKCRQKPRLRGQLFFSGRILFRLRRNVLRDGIELTDGGLPLAEAGGVSTALLCSFGKAA